MPLVTQPVLPSLVSPPRQLTLDLVKTPKPSLDNFVVGRNAEAVAALRAVAGGSGEQFVYLWGDVGAGRSHLLSALCPDTSSAEAPAWSADRSLYTVDDVERLQATQQQRLFGLLNDVRASGTARFVAAGNAAPMHLAMRDDVRTRLAWGLVYQVHALSDEEKAQALAAHATSRGLDLPGAITEYLLTHMQRDMRSLVAIVDALDTYALAVRKPLSVPLVRQWAEETAQKTEP